MTSLPPIDRDTALRLLEKQVQLAGAEYQYPGDVCYYMLNGAPDCLVGRALADYGVPLDVLQSWDHPTQTIEMLWGGYAANEWLTEESAVIFIAAQDSQDGGNTWGDALFAAESAIEDFDAGISLWP